jgi:hypothetical protein
MLAIIRPDSWNLPLFLHVLGAIILFGSTATVAILGFASRGRAEHAALLSRAALRTFLFGIVPGFILMRAGAQWIADKEFPDGAKTPGWVDVGFLVSEPGAVLLIILGVLTWMWKRRGTGGRAARFVPLLASLYVIALGIAMFAMSGKPGS